MTTTQLPTGTWNLDAAASTITVTVKKLGFMTVPATLDVVSGTIEIDDQHQVAAVEVVADAASYASKNPKRNEHVVSSDFLDADAHPSISFGCSSVAADGPGYSANGTVTVKGQTSPATVTVTDVVADGDGGSFSASMSVDRSSIGVDKMPSFIIGSDLQIAVDAVVVRAS